MYKSKPNQQILYLIILREIDKGANYKNNVQDLSVVFRTYHSRMASIYCQFVFLEVNLTG